MKEWYHISELEQRKREDIESGFNRCLGGPWAIHQLFVDQKRAKARMEADGYCETNVTPETGGEKSSGVNLFGFFGLVIVAAGAAAWYLGSKIPAEEEAPKTHETAI